MAERIEVNGLCVEADRDGRLTVAIGAAAVDLDTDDSYRLVLWLRETRVADRLSRVILHSHGLLEGI